MDDLTEKELLEELVLTFGTKKEIAQEDYPDRLPQIEKAEAQLRKIVEGHFSVIETDMGKWLYRFYESWKGCSLGMLDKEAEEAYAEICKRLGKSIADQEQVVDGLITQLEYAVLDQIKGKTSYDRPKARKKIKKILTRQPQKQMVTLCEVHEFCHNLLNEFDLDREDLIGIENELAKWLESKGIMVEK